MKLCECGCGKQCKNRFVSGHNSKFFKKDGTYKKISATLNNKHNILLKKVIAIGNYNSLNLSPADIFRYVLLAGGNSFVLCHNHPSNSLDPSEEDLQFTKKIVKGAEIMNICFLDHLIYGDNNFYSFKAHHLI